MSSKSLIVLPVILCTISTAFGQKMSYDDLPKLLKDSFETQYPDVRGDKWEKAGSKYEAVFKLDGEKITVIYNSKGVLQEIRKEIDFRDLPEAVLEALDGKKVKGTTSVIRGGKNLYEAEADGKILLLDEMGKPVKKTVNTLAPKVQ